MSENTRPVDSIEGRRQHPRVDCGDNRLHAMARFSDGQTQEFQMIARNISRGGISFWREKPMSIGAVCRLALPTRDGDMMGIEGKVTFSKRLGMTVNEVGVEFDRPLDEEEFGMLNIAERRETRAAG